MSMAPFSSRVPSASRLDCAETGDPSRLKAVSNKRNAQLKRQTFLIRLIVISPLSILRESMTMKSGRHPTNRAMAPQPAHCDPNGTSRFLEDGYLTDGGILSLLLRSSRGSGGCSQR